MEEFDLQGRDFVELHNLLKLTGMCHSGGTAKLMIAEGRVTVDGQLELRKRCKIRSGQTIEYEGLRISVT